MKTEELAQLLKKVFKIIKHIFDSIKDLIKRIASIREKIKKEKKHRQTWITIKDMRLDSQVINRKPRNLVKRIIK